MPVPLFTRVPSEGDIRGLSPSLADALLLARSVHGLCARRRSELKVPLDREEEAGAEAGGVGALDSRLWVNDKLSEVRGGERGRWGDGVSERRGGASLGAAVRVQ